MRHHDEEGLLSGKLLNLAPEVLDLIAAEILHPRDLLPFALTHSIIHNVVLPFHLHYRVIERALDDGSMWEHLEENPRRLENVRFLRLHVPENVYGPGGAWFHNDTEEPHPTRLPLSPNEGILKILPPHLIAKMTRLHAFSWEDHTAGTKPRSFSSLQAFSEYQGLLSTSLKTTCSQLQEFDGGEFLWQPHCPSVARASEDPDPIKVSNDFAG